MERRRHVGLLMERGFLRKPAGLLNDGNVNCDVTENAYHSINSRRGDLEQRQPGCLGRLTSAPSRFASGWGESRQVAPTLSFANRG